LPAAADARTAADSASWALVVSLRSMGMSCAPYEGMGLL
jgi:hypothetical protein